MFSLTMPDEVVVIILPYFHMAGFMTQSWAAIHGNLSIVLPKFDTKTYCQLVEKYRATACMVVPTILVFLAKSPLVDQYDLSSIRGIGFGAAPAGKEIISAIINRFPNVTRMVQVTSLTDGRELGPMEEGEICMKSAGNMKGYLNKPQATRDTIDQEGWLHSGDVGYFDHFGYFYIVDRVKELVKYKGFQVAPAELEDVIQKHGSVEEVAVTGITNPLDPDIGELPTAFVVLKNNPVVCRERIMAEIERIVADHCADYKRLRGGVHIVSELPKSGSGKVLRRQLRQKYSQRQAKL